MQTTITPIPEPLEAEAAEMSQRKYSLLVKFMMSNTPLMLHQGTHRQCMETAKTYFEFMKREHATHGSGMEFRPVMKNADTIVVMGTPLNQIHGGSRLWCTFEIREKVERSMYDKPMGEERPLVATEKQPVLSSTMTDDDLRFNWE